MPPPYVMGPQMQGAFDRTLGRPEVLGLVACSLGVRALLSDSESDGDDDDSDSDDTPVEELTLLSVVTMHCARRLRLFASLSLGGRPRVTSAHVSDEHTCRTTYRFTAPQIEELAHRMGLYDSGDRVVVGHDVFAPQEALLMTLYKLAFPSRLITMARHFNRHPSVISRAVNWVLGVYKRNFDAWIFADSASKHGLERWAQFIPSWIAAARSKGLRFDAVGHMDGSRLEITRPGELQEALYNGYYGRHCLNFLAFVFACGLIGFLHGPGCGPDHDAMRYSRSGLDRKLRRLFRGFPRYRAAGISADSAFGVEKYVYPLFKARKAKQLTAAQKALCVPLRAPRAHHAAGVGQMRATVSAPLRGRRGRVWPHCLTLFTTRFPATPTRPGLAASWWSGLSTR